MALNGGGIAQPGERLLCKQVVGGSIPPASTKEHCEEAMRGPVAQVARARA